MGDKIIRRIAEVKTQEDELRRRKKELDIFRLHILDEMTEISKQMWELQNEERLLKEQFRKEHTREFYRPMDEDDICNQILSNGSIKGFKF